MSERTLRSAREVFRIGENVRPTDEAYEAGLFHCYARGEPQGIIEGYSKYPYCVRVRSIGRKTSSTYHVDFWERSTDAQEKR